MAADVIVLKPAHERPALRLPRPSGRGGGAPAATVVVPVVAAGVGDGAVDADDEPSRWLVLLLNIGSVLGAVVLAITVFASQAGMRPLVVRSGSMEPTIDTGSMVLMRRVPASAIKVGDVVSVERPDHTRVTHRVIKLERPSASQAVLTLKGDNNEDPDPVPVTVTEAYRLVFSIGAVGRFTAWLATPAGGFALGCLVTAVATAVLRRRRPAVASSASAPASSPGTAVRRVAI